MSAAVSATGFALLETSASRNSSIKDAGGALFALGTLAFLGAAVWGSVEYSVCQQSDQVCFATPTGLECADSQFECERRRDELSATSPCVER